MTKINKLYSPTFNIRPKDPNHKAPNLKHILKMARFPLNKFICSKCESMYVDTFNSLELKNGSAQIICGKNHEVIGNKKSGADTEIDVFGTGLPTDCPYYLEYIMYVEGRKEARKKCLLLKSLWIL